MGFEIKMGCFGSEITWHWCIMAYIFYSFCETFNVVFWVSKVSCKKSRFSGWSDGWWRWTGMVTLVTGWQQTEAHKPWLNGFHLLSVERLHLLGRAIGWVLSEALGEALRWCFSAVILELKHSLPLVRFLSKLLRVSGWCWMETPRCKYNFPKN